MTVVLSLQSRLETEEKLQTTMKQLAAVQSRLQATEEDLCAQLALVKEQLMTESQVKEAVTAELMVQLSNVKKENGELQVSICHSSSEHSVPHLPWAALSSYYGAVFQTYSLEPIYWSLTQT